MTTGAPTALGIPTFADLDVPDLGPLGLGVILNAIDARVQSHQAPSPGTVAQIVKGAAAQSADLQQWQDSSGGVLAGVSAAGNFQISQMLKVGQLQATPTTSAFGIAFGANLDTLLYRSGVAQATLNGALTVSTLESAKAAAANEAIGVYVVGDTQLRLSMLADGTLLWGVGNLVADTRLYRSAPAFLKTDGSITIGPDGANHGCLELLPVTAAAPTVAHAGRLQLVLNATPKGELRIYWPSGGSTLLATEP